jgi:hypothetical protein
VLFILIPLAWLALTTFFVVLCRTAASADARLATAAAQPHSRTVRPGLVVWEDRRNLAHGARRSWHPARSCSTRRRRFVAHDVR